MKEHEKAILKALIDLDGRGTLHDIYPLARKYAVYEGKTPNNTVRRDLQQSIFVRRVEGTTGQYEIKPFHKIIQAKDAEIANLKLKVKDKIREFEELKATHAKEIAELKEKYSTKHCVTLEQVEAEIMECPDWATAKSRIDDINRSGILAETEWAKVAKRIQRGFKQKQEQIWTSQTEALQAVASRPTTLNNVYPQANSTTNVGCDQKDSEFKTYLPAAGVASAALEHNEGQKRIGGQEHE